MTHTYNISGMTCTGCQQKVEGELSKVGGVKKVSIDLAKGIADIEMTQHISKETLKNALRDYPKYQLTETATSSPVFSIDDTQEEKKSWFSIYKPILLIFSYITVISAIAALSDNNFSISQGMRIFMAGFFIIFSFFKMLDLGGFANSYSMYDIVAKKFKQWGYLYAFVELALGLAYAANFQPGIINYITLAVMTVSIIGVLQSVLNKRKIQCACLGAVFNLPMSTVTIFEDSLMIAMSVVMLAIMQ
ncbi:MAG: heavy metal transporter [Mucilaginibacter sp.]|nr:heavy metal transporter [Mucilaginibacter sp.]